METTMETGFVGATRRIRLVDLTDINGQEVTNITIGNGSVQWRIISEDNEILDSGPGTYNADLGWYSSITIPDSLPTIIIEWEITRSPGEKEYFQLPFAVVHRHL